MPDPATAVATLLVARDDGERQAALEAVAAEGSRALPQLEAALPDLARDFPGALTVAARLAAEGARRGEAASARLLDVLARTSVAEARSVALAALRGDETAARSGFALALEELVQGLAPSPLRDKLARVAQAPSFASEVAARAFAAAYEAARAASDARLLQLAREKLAPTLEEHGLVAIFERTADVGAFDVRPGSAGAGSGELGRPAVRSRAGAVVVRGVVFVAPVAPAAVSAPMSDAELVATLRRALQPGAAPETLEAARAALDAVEARLRSAR